MDWGVFFRTVGCSTLAVAVLAYLAKALVTLLFNREVERFKAQLERDNLEHEVRFRRVDERIAEALSEVYVVVYDLVDALRQYLHPCGAKEEPCKAFTEARKRFEDIFFHKRLYIPLDVFRKVYEFYSHSIRIADKFTDARERHEKGTETEEDRHFWTEAVEALNAEAEPLFAQIVLEFQGRIGVEHKQV